MGVLKFLAIATVGVVVALFISDQIDKKRIRHEAKAKFTNAFKLQILEKKKNAVKVGIFSNRNNEIDQMVIGGDKISSDIHVGQIIMV